MKNRIISGLGSAWFVGAAIASAYGVAWFLNAAEQSWHTCADWMLCLILSFAFLAIAVGLGVHAACGD